VNHFAGISNILYWAGDDLALLGGTPGRLCAHSASCWLLGDGGSAPRSSLDGVINQRTAGAGEMGAQHTSAATGIARCCSPWRSRIALSCCYLLGRYGRHVPVAGRRALVAGVHVLYLLAAADTPLRTRTVFFFFYAGAVRRGLNRPAWQRAAGAAAAGGRWAQLC